MGSGPDTTLGPRVFGADYFSNTKLQQLQKPTQGKKDLGPQEDYSKGNLQWKNVFRQYFHARSGQISSSTASEGQDRTRMRTLTPRGGADLPSR
jgi:hypothetical protein